MEKTTTINKKQLLFGAMFLLVSMLPGCWVRTWFSKDKDAGRQVLVQPDDPLLAAGEKIVCFGDRCIVSSLSLDRDFDQLLEENPQYKSVLPMMPNAKENYLQIVISQAIVDQFIEENKIHESADYQKDYAQMVRSIKKLLNTKHFGAAYPIEVSDSEVSEYYEANKTKIPDLLVSNGGIKAEGLSFETEEAAKNFAAAVKGKDFAKVAKEQKLDAKIQDFKLVNEQTIGIHAKVKNKIVSLTTFPATELVKAEDKAFWVVRALEKQDPKYMPLEQVHAGLKQYIEKERRMVLFDKEITRLKEEYKVTVNEGYFAKQKEEAQKVALMEEFNEPNFLEVPESVTTNVA